MDINSNTAILKQNFKTLMLLHTTNAEIYFYIHEELKDTQIVGYIDIPRTNKRMCSAIFNNITKNI